MTALRLSILLILALSAVATASVTFVAPLDGSQAIGPQSIEVTTDVLAVDRVEYYVDGVLVGVARTAPWRIVHDFGNSVSVRQVSARVLSDRYRNTQTVTIRTAALIAADSYNVDVVEVPLRVRSPGVLRSSDFRVRENNIEQRVREVKAERGPAQFVFIVDRSLSMGDGRLAAALNAIDAERRWLRAGDTVSVILFNHNVARPRPIAANENVTTLFAGAVTSGGTSLRDAVASTPQAPRTYAIVITDGGDRNSELSEGEALRRISGARTVVDALVLGEDGGRFLERAVRNTGGQIVATSRQSVGRELHRLILDINSRYTLVYQSHGTGNGWRAISVAAVRRGIEILSARKGYFSE